VTPPARGRLAALAVLLCAVAMSSCDRSPGRREVRPSAVSPAATSAATPTTPAPTSSPTPAGGTRVVVAADIACDPDHRAYAGGAGTERECRQRATAQLAARLRPAAVLLPGDLQYERGHLADFRATWARSWGRFDEISYPAPGNHEYGTGVAPGYFEYFGERAGPRGKGYYSAEIGGWHVVALNSNCELVGGCGADSPQVRWLRADLRRSTRRCTVALAHHPRWSSGLHGSSPKVDPLWRALVAGGADLLLSGHDHHYERFAPLSAAGARDERRGVRQFIVGTGGRSLYPVGFAKRGSEVRQASSFGVLELTLYADRYDWRFVPVDNGGFTDAGTGRCH